MRGWVSLPANHRLVQSTAASEDDDTLPQILQFCTDARSDKVTESLTQTSNTDSSQSSIGSEIVWWFPTVGEQYRLRGEWVFVGTGGRTNEQTRVRCDDNNNNKDPPLGTSSTRLVDQIVSSRSSVIFSNRSSRTSLCRRQQDVFD